MPLSRNQCFYNGSNNQTGMTLAFIADRYLLQQDGRSHRRVALHVIERKQPDSDRAGVALSA
jgi:hypothetical protein